MPIAVDPVATNHIYFGEANARLVFPFSLVIGSVNATMNRSSLVLLGAAALAACVDLGVPHGVPSLSIQPVLDSVFVGDRTLAHRVTRSEEHTSELQSRLHLVCRLLLEKKKQIR